MKKMTLLPNCRYGIMRQKRYMHSVLTYYPKVRCQEQQNQASYLTKTIVKNELPPSSVVNIPDAERENIIESIKRSIIETNYFHRDKEIKLTRHMFPKQKITMMEDFRCGLSMQVLLNMLRVLWTTESARENVGKTCMTYRSEIRAPWERLGTKMQVTGKHGHLINGKNLLPLFADDSEIEETADVTMGWDDVISPFFDLHPAPSTLEFNRGYYEGSPYPCPQTLLIVNPRYWKERHNIGQGMFYSFAHAMTYALSRGEQMGTDLKNPIPIQCIVFTGVKIYHICYQLNTLDFNDESSGIKNIAWTNGEQRLYEQVTDKESESSDFIEYQTERVSLTDFDRKVLSETFSDEKNIKLSIEGYDREAVSNFTDFLLRK